MSLYEVLFSILLFGFVLSAILGLLDVTTKLAPKDRERQAVIAEARVGLDRMTRELRQAYRVQGTSPTTMDVLVTLRRQDSQGNEVGVDRHLRYECDDPHPDDPANAYDQAYRRCIRQEAAIGADIDTSPRQVVIDRVVNDDVFSFDDPISPRYVTVKIHTPARGTLKEGHRYTVRFNDGVHLRNLHLNG